MKTIFATFTGTNGSLGYTTGVRYKLTLKEFVRGGVWITRQDISGGTCEYASFMNFLDNWNDIYVEE